MVGTVPVIQVLLDVDYIVTNLGKKPPKPDLCCTACSWLVLNHNVLQGLHLIIISVLSYFYDRYCQVEEIDVQAFNGTTTCNCVNIAKSLHVVFGCGATRTSSWQSLIRKIKPTISRPISASNIPKSPLPTMSMANLYSYSCLASSSCTFLRIRVAALIALLIARSTLQISKHHEQVSLWGNLLTNQVHQLSTNQKSGSALNLVILNLRSPHMKLV